MSLPYFTLCYYLTLQGCVLSPLISIPLTPFSRGHIRAYGLSIAARLPCPPTPARHLKMPSLSRAGSCRSSANNINEERRGQKPTICTPVKINLVVDGGKNPTIRPRAISFSGSQQAQASCNLTCFHDAYRAVITVMGEPNSGIARGELRSTLSLAGSCRSSGQHQSTKKSSCRPIHSSCCPIQ